MPLLLLALLIGVPLIEIGVFIEVGGWLGLWPTLAVILATAIAGAALLRAQGIATMTRARSELEQGVMPMREIFDGLCLLVAGALLLTPGFVTDGLGFLLFLPPFRAAIARAVASRVKVHGPGGARRPDDGVIDGEWEEVPREPPPGLDQPPRPPGDNPWKVG